MNGENGGVTHQTNLENTALTIKNVLELVVPTNAALSGQKLWVIMCSEAKRNPLFLFRLNALLAEPYLSTASTNFVKDCAMGASNVALYTAPVSGRI